MRTTNEANNERLLTREEEIALCERFKQIIPDPEDSSKPKVINMDPMTPDARKARDELLNRNLRLVASITRHYLNRGMDQEDLMQEGHLGLIRAADKFNHTLGWKYSTYASYWIKQAITRAIADQSRTIRIPVHITEMVTQIAKAYKKIAGNNRYVQPEEIAEISGLDAYKIQSLIPVIQQTVSIHDFIDGSDMTIEELMITDDSQDDQIRLSKIVENLEIALSQLPKREEEVLRLRYGLGVTMKPTLEEIGAHLNITRERARQIEMRALRRMRANFVLSNEEDE